MLPSSSNSLSHEVALLLSLNRATEHTTHDLNYSRLHDDSALNKIAALTKKSGLSLAVPTFRYFIMEQTL